MKIKICGLKRNEDIDYVNQSNPDFIGFVFAGTKRKIDFETAKRLKERLAHSIPSVGVFVNAEIDFIVRLVTAHILDCVQLHGDEDENYILALRLALTKIHRGDITIIKAVRVKNREQVLEAEKLSVDYLLLDAFTAGEYGGSGTLFNHDWIPELSKPYFLAGGITGENVIPILEALREKNHLPYCIDVSSSVETDGYKDERKIHEIVKLVHEAD